MSLASVAEARAFELPVCEDCGAVQYPVRAVCLRCLSDRLRWQPQPAGATVLAVTRLHRSMDERFAPRLPLTLGSVRLDAGPVAIALLPGGSRIADRVVLNFQPAAEGRVQLIANFFPREKTP